MHKLWRKAEIEIMKQLDHVSSLGDEVVLSEVGHVMYISPSCETDNRNLAVTLLHRFVH